MENLVIRKTMPEDLETLLQLKIDAFMDEFELFQYEKHPLYQPIVRSCNLAHADDDYMFSHDWHQYFSTLDQQGAGDFSYVAIQNESIIGAVCALPGEYSGEEYAGIPLQEYNVIICIYVHPEHKNRGIGTKLLAFMEQQHADRPWILDTPEISVKNQHFYAKCGYKKKLLEDGKYVFIIERDTQ